MSEPVRILVGDVLDGLRTLPAGSVHCAVTSPPYWGLRDYGVEGQIGLEPTPDAFVAEMVDVFREVRRVLRDDGTLWLNIGDSYAGSGRGGYPGGAGTLNGSVEGQNNSREARMVQSRRRDNEPVPRSDVSFLGLKPKHLCMIPWRVALALQADGWWIRSVIVWAKKSPMPESVKDRPTSSWEPIFLMAKSERYFYDAEAVRQPLSEAAVERQKYGFKHMYGNIIAANQHADARSFEDAKSYGADDVPSGANLRNVWHLGPEPFSESLEIVHWLPVEAGACGDGIRRTPSEGCPVHGCRDPRPDDERAGDQTTRSPGSVIRPGAEQYRVRYASSLNLGELDRVHSWDCSCPLCSQTAIERSTQSRKTGHAPATTPPCTPSSGTGIGMSDKSGPHATIGSAEHTPESRTVEDSASRGPGSCGDQTTSRSVGSCTCEYHRRYTKKTDHFATFPTEIPRRAIKAGTSEKGCCPACGAPWRRIVAREKLTRHRPNAITKRDGADGTGNHCANTVAGVATRTTGWEPTCQCPPADPVPCTVLDPFLGSGTTVAVARELGRHGVGCELNPEYAALARIRIGKAEKPSTFVDPRAKDAPLFA